MLANKPGANCGGTSNLEHNHYCSDAVFTLHQSKGYAYKKLSQGQCALKSICCKLRIKNILGSQEKRDKIDKKRWYCMIVDRVSR